MRLKWQDSENGATTKKAWVATNWLPLGRLITLIYINEVKNDAKKHYNKTWSAYKTLENAEFE